MAPHLLLGSATYLSHPNVTLSLIQRKPTSTTTFMKYTNTTIENHSIIKCFILDKNSRIRKK